VLGAGPEGLNSKHFPQPQDDPRPTVYQQFGGSRQFKQLTPIAFRHICRFDLPVYQRTILASQVLIHDLPPFSRVMPVAGLAEVIVNNSTTLVYIIDQAALGMLRCTS
jgi:hypothetical protein